ncbi:MAG: DNA/RNA non-specific endonuclease [Bacteroidales bacterium]|nr:DNA/RNA non-specific endonuclease [Bacteroidales bacterium]
MKVKPFIFLLALGAVLSACSKPASLSVFSSSLQIAFSGGEAQISFITNQDWSVSSSQPWLTLSPESGSGSESSQRVMITVSENPGESERSADVTVRAGEMSQVVHVTQSGMPRLSISEFLSKKADKNTWYKLTGQIASIANESYGNFYITDDTGYVYVYGLCEKQVSTNDQSFSKLKLKAGDTVTMMTLRSEHNGTPEAGGQIPAYFVSKTEGTYKMGKKVKAASEKWLELPATSASDKQDLLIHYFPGGKRSYAAYWDYDNLVSSWVAYPLCAGNIGTGGRTDSFSLDPLLDRKQQQYNPYAYKAGNGGTYDRGHQIPSADRLDYAVNLETFFSTNMTPQDPGLNSNAWAVLEGKVRDWAKKSDTLYVVTGCTVAGSTTYVLDSDDKHITVPTGYYKALLRLSKGDYSGLGIYFDNKPNDAPSIQKSMTMSLDDLEKKVGVDFFVNLPADVQKSVEAQNPADVAWWWNN